MKVNKTRRNAFAGLALAAILGTTGCSFVNPQATTLEYAPSDGTQTTVYAAGHAPAGSGGLDEYPTAARVNLLNIAVVTDSAGESGRLIGTIDNKSDSSHEVELQINDESFSFELEANEILSLTEEELTVENVGTEPGQLTDGVASAFGNESEFNVPILPPTLEHYREIYPEDVDIQQQTEHLYDFQGQYSDEDTP